MVCDFCSTPKIAWKYHAELFEAWQTDALVGVSTGDWAACETCKDLIEAGNREALVARCFEVLLFEHIEVVMMTEEETKNLKVQIADVFTKFFDHMLKLPPEPCYT